MDKQILVEFFDHESLENLISLEDGQYSKVVYLYFDGVNAPDRQEEQVLSRFLQRRFGMTAEFCPVQEMTIPGICAAFDRILEGKWGGVIDLTGGPEVFSAAAGYYAARSKGRMIALQQFDVAGGKRIFRYPRGEDAIQRLELTVEESVALQCAAVLDSTPVQLGGVMEKETLRLWGAVNDIPRQWNHFCTLPAFTPAQYRSRQEKGVFSKGDSTAYDAVAARLRKLGVMRREERMRVENRDYMVFDLDVPEEARVLYEKGGNLLEHYCAVAAQRAGVFRECRVSVSLDWDGEKRQHSVDVRNEVDVVLIYGHIPVFVSCKNTRVENEHLYEIAAMARHYGGRYARAAIVSNADNLPAIRLRAKEMGILLVDELSRRSLDEVVRVFRTHFPPRIEEKKSK